jgi:hypothetical protein
MRLFYHWRIKMRLLKGWGTCIKRWLFNGWGMKMRQLMAWWPHHPIIILTSSLGHCCSVEQNIRSVPFLGCCSTLPNLPCRILCSVFQSSTKDFRSYCPGPRSASFWNWQLLSDDTTMRIWPFLPLRHKTAVLFYYKCGNIGLKNRFYCIKIANILWIHNFFSTLIISIIVMSQIPW